MQIVTSAVRTIYLPCVQYRGNSTPAVKETGREAEEEKTQDLNERRLSGKLGDKIDDDVGDTLSADKVTRCRRIAARANFVAQDGHRICHKKSDQENDIRHQR